jgi:hypothetical protein
MQQQRGSLSSFRPLLGPAGFGTNNLCIRTAIWLPGFTGPIPPPISIRVILCNYLSDIPDLIITMISLSSS